jgi:hypothetical protein
MFPPTPIPLESDRHVNAVLTQNLFLTKLKYNPTKSDKSNQAR